MTVSSVSGSSLMQQLQQAMFKSADVNSDGQLSSEEFSSIGQQVQGGGKNGHAPPMKGAASASQNFSGDMLSSFLSMQGAGPPQGPDTEEMFASADADSDGSVTSDELIADLQSHAPDGADSSRASDMAARMIEDGDADGDGALSKDEMSSLKPQGGPRGMGGPPPGGPPPSGGAGGTEEADSSSSSSSSGSYDAADTNKDGKVSASELLAALQSAVSSSETEATSSDSFSLLADLLTKLQAGSEKSSSASVAVAA